MKYLERTLNLRVNREKSRTVSVIAIRNFKYLGFCIGKGKNGVFIRVHPKSYMKFNWGFYDLAIAYQSMHVNC